MTLKEILKANGIADETIEKVGLEMKANSIFTTNEENLDIRFRKLKTENDALVAKDEESQKLILELQASTQGQAELQTKISEYQSTIQNQAEELEKTKLDSALKVALLGAKAVDVDYLTYKLKQGDGEIKLDKDGNIKGIEDLLGNLQKECPSMFENSATKKFDSKKLPEQTGDENKITKEAFDKMGYQDRLNLYNESPDLYNELKKG